MLFNRGVAVIQLNMLFRWHFTVYVLLISSLLDSLTVNRLRRLPGRSLKVGLGLGIPSEARRRRRSG